jgi:hypothetical protein
LANLKFLPRTSIVRSLLTPRFEQCNGCRRGLPSIRPGAVVERGSHAPAAENGLDHPGIGACADHDLSAGRTAIGLATGYADWV